MPIYEYACGDCATEFETLVRPGSTPQCPSCHSTRLDKLLSVFATTSTTQVPAVAASGPCGTCGHPDGTGACAFND